MISIWSEFPCWHPYLAMGRYSQETRNDWRINFLKRIKSLGDEWGDIMVAGMKRLPESERETVLERFNEAAEGEPLFYLNLCGVPPLEVLSGLEETEVRRRAVKYLTKVKAADEVTLKKTVLQQKQVIERYGNLFVYLYRKDLTDVQNAFSDFETALKQFMGAVALLIHQSKRAGTRGKRRLTPQDEFGYAIKKIISTISSEMSSMSQPEWDRFYDRESDEKLKLYRTDTPLDQLDQLSNQIHQRLLKERFSPWDRTVYAAATCLVKAAFPDWFRDGNNPEKALRKVKAGWKSKHQIVLPDPQVDSFIKYFKSFSLQNVGGNE